MVYQVCSKLEDLLDSDKGSILYYRFPLYSGDIPEENVEAETFTCFAIKMYSPSTWKDSLVKGFITDTDYEFKKYSKEVPQDLWISCERRDLYLI